MSDWSAARAPAAAAQPALQCSSATLRRMWTVAARFSTLGEAESARSALDAAGIASRTADENMIAVDWLYSNALGGIKVLVPEERLEDAMEVLNVTAGDAPEGAEETTPADELDDEIAPLTLRCKECGSDDVQRIPRLKLFLGLGVIAYGVGVAAEEPGLALALIGAVAIIAGATPSHRC